jgi:hypothetical protein
MEYIQDIPGYEGLYAVTRDGKVWSYPKKSRVGRNGGFRMDGNKWLKPFKSVSASGKPYHRLSIADANGRRKSLLVHRIVAQTYIPNPDKLPFINHLNGATLDNRVENLEWCTAKRNTKHAYDNGWIRTPKQQGERNSQAKMTEADARRVKKLSRDGMGDTAISRETGINRSAVKDITKGKTWRHIQ